MSPFIYIVGLVSMVLSIALVTRGYQLYRAGKRNYESAVDPVVTAAVLLFVFFPLIMIGAYLSVIMTSGYLILKIAAGLLLTYFVVLFIIKGFDSYKTTKAKKQGRSTEPTPEPVKKVPFWNIITTWIRTFLLSGAIYIAELYLNHGNFIVPLLTFVGLGVLSFVLCSLIPVDLAEKSIFSKQSPDITILKKETDELKTMFLKLHPEYSVYKEETRWTRIKAGQIETLFGRPLHLSTKEVCLSDCTDQLIKETLFKEGNLPIGVNLFFTGPNNSIISLEFTNHVLTARSDRYLERTFNGFSPFGRMASIYLSDL